MACNRWIFFCLPLLLSVICNAQPLDNDGGAQTFVIGTADKPTIEGGIINTPPIKKPERNFTNDVFQDEFNNDKNIKSFLTEAAKEGKLATVLQRAEQLKLPASVALIPMVESGYQTNAVSPKGATGAWQLMPETAKAYGVQNHERCQFTTSTDAALHLLKDLHHQFHNWTLAFAAYNAGSARLKHALYGCPGAKKMDELDLPSETKNYIHRLKVLHQMMTRLSSTDATFNVTA